MKTGYFIALFLIGFVINMFLFSGCKKKDDLNNLNCSKINSKYASHVKPIIDANCLSSGCHNSGSVHGDFTTYTGVKTKVDNGSFDSRVIQGKNMPLSGSLSLDELKKIKCWLNSGASNN